MFNLNEVCIHFYLLICLDQLKIQIKKVEVLINGDLTAAKTFVAAKNQARALIALKKKKLHEDLLININNQLFTLESLIQDIEAAYIQKTVLEALATGVNVMKSVQKEIQAMNVNQLMDDSQEIQENIKEVDALLAGNVDSLSVDDKKLLEDLDKLAEEIDLEDTVNLPTVPTAAPKNSSATQNKNSASVAQQPRTKEQPLLSA